MMYTKTFQNKYHMKNYLKKMETNEKINIICTALSFEHKGWTIFYQYKKI